MSNFNFLEKGLVIVSPPHFEEKCFSCYIPLSDYFLFFKKALYEVKATDLQLSFNIFAQPSKKGLGIVSPRDFVSDFVRKIFLMLYSIS